MERFKPAHYNLRVTDTKSLKSKKLINAVAVVMREVSEDFALSLLISKFGVESQVTLVREAVKGEFSKADRPTRLSVSSAMRFVLKRNDFSCFKRPPTKKEKDDK